MSAPHDHPAEPGEESSDFLEGAESSDFQSDDFQSDFQSGEERQRHAEDHPWHELLSAQLDGALAADEEEALLAHLASDSAAQRQRRRIGRLVRTLRGAGPYLAVTSEARSRALGALEARLEREVDLEAREPTPLGPEVRDALRRGGPLVPVSGSDYVELESRLAAEAAKEALELSKEDDLGDEPALRVLAGGDLVLGSDALSLRDDPLTLRESDEVRELPGFSVQPARERTRRRRLSPAAVRAAVAAAILLSLGALAITGGERVREAFQAAWLTPTPAPSAGPVHKVPSASPSPSASPEQGIALLPSPTLSPRETPRPSEAPQETPRASVAPSPTPGPSPRETPLPAPSQTPTQHTGEGTQQRPVVTPPPAVEVDLAALRQEIRRICDPQCPGPERGERLEGLARQSFDHPEAYAFLERVLREGFLDQLSGPNEARRAAVLALGRFGGVRAAESLLRVPLRAGHMESDAANYRQAVAFLSEPEALAKVSLGIASGPGTPLAHERRHAAILGLGDRAHPAATDGLLALYASKRLPEELRRDAGRVVGRCGNAKAFGPLLAGLKTKRRSAWRLRQGAAWGLGGLAASLPSEAGDCVKVLGEATNSGHPLVDEAAIQALGRTRTRLAVEPLLDLLDDRRSGVRRLAHRSLCYLAGREPKGVRGAAAWRAFWGKVPGGLPKVPREDLDLASFRDLPSRSGGVVFVVDASGSMATRWDLVRYELQAALERCGPGTRFQLLFFSDAAKALWNKRGMAPATAQNRAQAMKWVAAQRAIDVAQTGLSKAMEEALRGYEGADQIYLISDAILSQEDYWDLRTRVERWNRRRARPLAVNAIHIRDGSASVRWEPRPPQLQAGAQAVPADVDFMHRLAWENNGIYAHN